MTEAISYSSDSGVSLDVRVICKIGCMLCGVINQIILDGIRRVYSILVLHTLQGNPLIQRMNWPASDYLYGVV